MLETQESITKWALKTFGEVKELNVIVGKLMDEVNELHDYRFTGLSKENRKYVAEECADILIVLFQIAEMVGVNLLVEVDKKMEVNRKRKWKKKGGGIGQHVKKENVK